MQGQVFIKIDVYCIDYMCVQRKACDIFCRTAWVDLPFLTILHVHVHVAPVHSG